MLHDVISAIEHKLNAALIRRFPANQNWVVSSDPLDAAGNPRPELYHKLVLTLVNIEEERAATSPAQTQSRGVGQESLTLQMNLNLYVLLSAQFDGNYADGLKLLSAAMTVLRTDPVLTPQNTPNLPDLIDRLSIELSNTDLADIRDIWASLGMPAKPCVLYKIRGLFGDLDKAIDVGGPVRAVPTDN